MLATWIANVRYAARRLRTRPGYAFLAVITLALGVGGTAATYGVARGVLFDPLPYPHAREVGVFWKKTDWTHEEFLHIRGQVPGFRTVALYRWRDVVLRDGDKPARLIPGITASSELFDVLGVGPLIGRGFRTGDDVPSAERVAILSYGLWQEMGGDSSIIGAGVTLDGAPRTIVGVMPRGFWFPDPLVRIWTPEPLTPDSKSWNSTLIGRVAPGVDVRAMQGPVEQLVAMLDARFDYPAQWDKTKNAHITPLRDDFTGDMRPALLATLGAMALILLIACANVAALMLGQVDMRSVEFAVRSSLGASQQRLIQPLIAEAVLIAIAAGAVAAGIAWGGFTMLTRALPLGAWAESAAPDWRVFVSAMTIALLATFVVIIVPIVSIYRSDLRTVLSRARTGGIGSRGGYLENGLVVAEVALTVLIATGAALLTRTVMNLYAINPGVSTDGVAVVDVMISGNVPRARKVQTIEEVTKALTELAGVRSVGATQKLPLRGGGYNLTMSAEGLGDIEGMTSEYRIVTAGYLESVGIPLRQGRTITEADRRGMERVVVINEALAQKVFANVEPIGKRVGGDIGGTPALVVGVVGNAVEKSLTDAAVPVRYVAVGQMPWVDDPQSIVLRAAPGVEETSLLESARRTIQRVAPAVAVQQTTTMRRVLDSAVGPARQVVLLLSLLTALAVTLGAVGVYGVIAHFATRRQREWAIRVALGLPGSRVIVHVVRHGALLVIGGIVLGIGGASILTRTLSSLLYGVRAIDPFAFAAAASMLLIVGLLAALVPAWRAGMTDPGIVLRDQ